MSGKKRTKVTVDEQYLAKIRNDAAKAQSLEGEVSILHSQIKKKEEEIRRHSQAMKDQEEKLRKLLAKLRETEAATREEAAKLRAALEGQIMDLGNRIQITEEGLKEVERRIAADDSDIDAVLAMAEEYSIAAGNLIRQLEEEYPVELLVPGGMEPARRKQEAAGRDLTEARGRRVLAATARLTAREAYEEAATLYQEVLRQQNLWEKARAAAQWAVDQADIAIMENARIKMGEEYEGAEIDVDFWSSGDLRSLSNRRRALAEGLNHSQEYTIAQLENIQAAADRIREELQETRTFAVLAAVSSQNRADIAADLYEKLKERLGMEVEDFAYEGEDMRGAYRIHLKNPVTGLDLVITQRPVLQEDGTIALEQSSDILNYGVASMQDADRVARDVLGSIAEAGIYCQTQVVTEAGFDNRTSDETEVADLESFRHSVTKAPKPVHANR